MRRAPRPIRSPLRSGERDTGFGIYVLDGAVALDHVEDAAVVVGERQAKEDVLPDEACRSLLVQDDSLFIAHLVSLPRKRRTRVVVS